MDTFYIAFLDLCITAAAYLFVPALLCARGKKLALPQIKKVVIINGACVWLIFSIIKIELGIDGTSAAVFLWSALAYWLMKKCLIIKETNNPTQRTPNQRKVNLNWSDPNETEPKSTSSGLHVRGSDIALHPEEKTDLPFVTAPPDFQANIPNKNEFQGGFVINGTDLSQKANSHNIRQGIYNRNKHKAFTERIIYLIIILILSVLLIGSIACNIIQLIIIQKNQEEADNKYYTTNYSYDEFNSSTAIWDPEAKEWITQ